MEVAVVVVCWSGGELGNSEQGIGDVFSIFYSICLSQLFFVTLHFVCTKYNMTNYKLLKY